MKKKEQTRMLLLAFFCIVFCGQTKAQVLTITKPDGLNYGFYMYGVCSITGYSRTVKDITIPATTYLEEEYENGYWELYAGYHNVISVRGFSDCQTIESVTIKDGDQSIDTEAFARCPNLTTLYWPICGKNGNSIASEAFANCKKLSSVTLPDNLSCISSGAFVGCTSLTNIELPSGLTYLDDASFKDCSSLTSVKFNKGKDLYIGQWVFENCTSLKEITIPSNATIINRHAFLNCSNLERVTISDGTETLKIGGASSSPYTPELPFEGCNVKFLHLGRPIDANPGISTLQELTIGNSVTSLGDWFKENKSLTRVTLPNALTSMWFTFMNCTSLRKIILPKSLTSIYGAFVGCSALQNVYCYVEDPSQMTDNTYFDGTFGGIPETATLHVPKGKRPLYAKYDLWNGFRFIKEMGITQIKNINQLSNSKIYKIEAEDAKRGIICAKNGVGYLEACGGIEPYKNTDIEINDNNSNQQFAIYNYDGEYYLYNIGQKKFLSRYEYTGDNIYFKMSDTPECPITITPSSVSDEFIFAVDGKEWINVSSWTYGCVGDYTTEDGGNRLSIIEVGDLPVKTQMEICDALNELTGIKAKNAETETGEGISFNLHGQKQPHPTKGINIIRSADGKTGKVLVK